MKKNSIVVVLRVALGLMAWFLITMGFSKILGPRLSGKLPENMMLFMSAMFIPNTVGIEGFLLIAGKMEKESSSGEAPVTVALLLKSLIIQLGISIPVATVTNIIIRVLGGNVGSDMSAALFGKNWIFYAILLLIFNPIFEELLYRKMVLERLLVLDKKEAIIISAVLFALPHAISQGIPQLFATFIAGLVWGYIRVKTGKLWPGMVLHALFNLFCGYVVSALAASQVGAVAMVLIFLMLLPVMAVFNVKKLKKTEDFFKGISF
ncbi:CPBP family intramembrane metalloprotease [Butyrivibrio sp. DSM 10294]|uniref:CPBP family intramembrane glutamic endopeptidase n=1 Tax=Butyrivibrio sp. DSM 10294 TaxID=2972457 RepID=UPI00234EB8F4|nr:type II CAAX endopeptidase family protein [Butyrivibrio sp. DSM 10294]MDC7293404.1 CPBP family intramembrane metalloprotease [Butyrivibrio sp. DSM 10294]